MIRSAILISILVFSFSLPVSAETKKLWISMEPQIERLFQNNKTITQWEKITGIHETFFLVDENSLPAITHIIHHEFKRCGGYRVLNNRPTEKEINRPAGFIPENLSSKLVMPDYFINQEEKVNLMSRGLSEFYMNSVITKLSSYKTRYYKAPEGIEAFRWIADEWKRLTKSRSDVTIENYNYSNHSQPSIILTFKGSDETAEDNVADQIIILGGHGDSINTDSESIHTPAPGADDNAAGIAVLSAIVKSLVENDYQPKHTIQFIAYAAEEVGIQGSYELARVYREQQKKVVGVLQFDGLNYSGKSYDLALISDNTHPEQNAFLAQLVDLYLHVPWTWDKCGYACSDHAAWNFEGFRASYPIEGIKRDQNPFIHTVKDTFARSANSSAHAKKFAKLGMAFLVELDQ